MVRVFNSKLKLTKFSLAVFCYLQSNQFSDVGKSFIDMANHL